MNTKMNKLLACVFLTIFLVGIASALTPYQNTISKDMSFTSRISYLFEKGGFLFSAWGQANDCSLNPDWNGVVSKGQTVSCSGKCAIDSWLESYKLLPGKTEPTGVLWQTYLGEVHGTGVSFTCNYAYCYSEKYDCPLTTSSTPTTQTTVYKCSNGNWVNIGSFGYKDSCSASSSRTCWCSNANNNFYIDKNGGEHCQPSSYSSVTDGTWCTPSTAVSNVVKAEGDGGFQEVTAYDNGTMIDTKTTASGETTTTVTYFDNRTGNTLPYDPGVKGLSGTGTSGEGTNNQINVNIPSSASEETAGFDLNGILNMKVGGISLMYIIIGLIALAIILRLFKK